MKNKELSWKNITLRQSIELFNLKKEEFEDDLDYYLEQLSILEDIDIATLENLTPNEIVDKIKQYDFIKVLPKEKHINTIKINKRKYGFMEFNKLSLAQMIDIEEYVNEGITNNIHKIISVILLPIKKQNIFTKKYILEEYVPSEERENDILDLDMEFVYSNLLFFYHIVNEFTNNLKDSLVEKTLEKTQNQIEILKEQLNK